MAFLDGGNFCKNVMNRFFFSFVILGIHTIFIIYLQVLPKNVLDFVFIMFLSLQSTYVCMYLISIEGMYLSRQTNQSEVSLNMKEPDVPNDREGFNKRAE